MFHLSFRDSCWSKDVCFVAGRKSNKLRGVWGEVFFWFSSSLHRWTDFDLSSAEEKEHLEELRWSSTAQCTRFTQLSGLYRSFLILAVEQVQFFLYISDSFLHLADMRGYLIKSALTIWALIWSSRHAPQIHTFVNVFFLPGTKPVEGNKCGLGLWLRTFLITIQRGGSFGLS